LWVEGGDLVDLVAPNMVFFKLGTSSLRWKKGRDIYTRPQERAVAVVVTPTISGPGPKKASLGEAEISREIYAPPYRMVAPPD
jgi:hypothetical protein